MGIIPAIIIIFVPLIALFVIEILRYYHVKKQHEEIQHGQQRVLNRKYSDREINFDFGCDFEGAAEGEEEDELRMRSGSSKKKQDFTDASGDFWQNVLQLWVKGL
eukprot:gene36019-44426_t